MWFCRPYHLQICKFSFIFYFSWNLILCISVLGCVYRMDYKQSYFASSAPWNCISFYYPNQDLWFIYQNRFTTVATDKACYDYSPIHSLSTEIVQPECNDLIIYNYLLNSKCLNSPNYGGNAANDSTLLDQNSKWKNLSDEILQKYHVSGKNKFWIL